MEEKLESVAPCIKFPCAVVEVGGRKEVMSVTGWADSLISDRI